MPAPNESTYCGDFFAGVQWVTDRLAWEMAAPQGSETQAWVRGVSGAWQSEKFSDIAQYSPWILVSPGVATAPAQQSEMVALDCQITVALIVSTQLMSHQPQRARALGRLSGGHQNHPAASRLGSRPASQLHPGSGHISIYPACVRRIKTTAYIPRCAARFKRSAASR